MSHVTNVTIVTIVTKPSSGVQATLPATSWKMNGQSRSGWWLGAPAPTALAGKCWSSGRARSAEGFRAGQGLAGRSAAVGLGNQGSGSELQGSVLFG